MIIKKGITKLKGKFLFPVQQFFDSEDILGNVSTTFYNDVLDRPTQTISANNRASFRRQSTIIYNDDVNIRKVTVTADSKAFGDNLLKSESFYDKLGRTTETRSYEDSANYIAGLTQYDSLGRAYRSSNPFRPYLNEQPVWTTSSFDSLGRVVEVKTPDNGFVTRSYAGSTTTVTDQFARKRSGTSDALGRLLKVNEDPNGLNYETNYTYDILGRLRKTTQGGQSRYFMYNDLGRLIRAKQTEQTANANLAITDPITGNANWSVAYSYDNNGNVATTTDSRNITITGTYDNLNRLTLRDYSDATPDVSFTFDDNITNAKGQLTAVSSTVSATNYTAFDQLGRIKSSQQMTNGQTYNFPDYTYDFSGALVSETYPSLRVVKTQTDDLGRLSKVTSQNPNQFEKTLISNLAYTSFGGVSQAKLGNGRWESMQFDGKTLQTTQIGLGGSAGNTSLLKLEYNYGTTTATTSDNNGSLRQQKITVAGASAPIVQNYSYDSLNRLQSATETANNTSTVTWKQTFDYDRFGNRRFDANNTTTLPANNGIYNPNIGADNKFLVSEGYNYDSEGNLTSNPESQLFQYDAENHQTQVTNTAAQTSANYQYDGGGKRVRKTFGNEETIFVYDAFGKMIAEYSNVIDTTRPKTTSYLTTDALGSPRIITNSIGQVISRHDYMPFGEEVTANVGGRTTTQGYAGNDGVKQKFTGYERDIESGLDYAQARYFSSKHGRFTSVDPLAASANVKDPQTLNRYSYGNNSPYKFTDPLGLSPNQGSGSNDYYDDENQEYRGREAEFGDESRRSEAEYDRRIQTKSDNRDQMDDTICRASGREGPCARDQDDRPYIGDMVPTNANDGLETLNGSDRFGTGHDGSHWLTHAAGTPVSGIAGLTGTVLTYYNQYVGKDTNWAVLILLDDKQTVLIIKDLQSLSSKIMQAPRTSSGNTALFNKNGSPKSKVRLEVGDKIGETQASTAFNKVGGMFHFGFIKAEYVQQFRDLKAKGGDVFDGTPAQILAMQKQGYTVIPLNWFIAPCGNGSPARCH